MVSLSHFLSAQVKANISGSDWLSDQGQGLQRKFPRSIESSNCRQRIRRCCWKKRLRKNGKSSFTHSSGPASTFGHTLKLPQRILNALSPARVNHLLIATCCLLLPSFACTFGQYAISYLLSFFLTLPSSIVHDGTHASSETMTDHH
jgi:hypothetical protein